MQNIPYTIYKIKKEIKKNPFGLRDPMINLAKFIGI